MPINSSLNFYSINPLKHLLIFSFPLQDQEDSIIMPESDDYNQKKHMKLSPCIACLGLLQHKGAGKKLLDSVSLI